MLNYPRRCCLQLIRGLPAYANYMVANPAIVLCQFEANAAVGAGNQNNPFFHRSFPYE
jgi:hypothetical protein